MRASIIAVGLFAFLSSACSDASKAKETGGAPTFGDAALVKMEAAGGVRYEVAIALAGAAVDSFVEPISSSIARAFGACPEVGKAIARGEIVSVRFSVRGGSVSRADDSVGASDPCLATELTRSGLPTKESFEVWAQLRKPPSAP